MQNKVGMIAGTSKSGTLLPMFERREINPTWNMISAVLYDIEPDHDNKYSTELEKRNLS